MADYLMNKYKEFNEKIKNKKYNEAYECGKDLLDTCYDNSEFIKNFVSCSIFINKKKSTLRKINKIIKEKEVKPILNKLAAGLAYHLKDEEENRRHTFIMAKKYPLWRKKEYKNAKIKVVVLYAATSGAYRYRPHAKDFLFGGNCNLSNFIASDINVYRVWADDFEVAKKSIESLGTIDVIYNSITEPEKCRAALESADRICDYFEKKGLYVINKPKNVFLTERSLQQKQFGEKNHILYPKNIKLFNIRRNSDEEIKKAIAENNLSYPIIVRLAGYSAGNYMHLVEKENAYNFSDFDSIISESNPKDIYLIEYVDVSFKNKNKETLYPKYRAILMGDKLYPVHLRIAKEYAVFHSNSKACMDENPWIIELDKRYCSKPTDVIDRKLWKAIEKMLKETGLDYVGIDFSIAKDINGKEKVVVFETSAGMRCWLDRIDTYVHVRIAWEKIVRRFCRLLCDTSGVATWDFHLPRKMK